jgi:hypothetical protein
VGQSKVAKSRPFLPAVLCLLTVAAVGVPLFPLWGAIGFRDGVGGMAERTGTATIQSCDTSSYGLIYRCEAAVVWPERYKPSPPPVREVVRANHALSGEVKVEERTTGRSRYRTTVVPVEHPRDVSLGAVLLMVLLGAVIIGPGGIVFWQAHKRLRKPLPETPPESTELRSAQVSRDKVRRRRRKTNR